MRKKRILSDEHKKKIGEALKGRKRFLSQQWLENIRKAGAKRKGIPTGPPTEEHKEKIRLATIGKKKTIVRPNPSWFKKGHIPECGFKKGQVSPNKGKIMPKHVKIALFYGKRIHVRSPEEIERFRTSRLKQYENHTYVEYRSSRKYVEFQKRIIAKKSTCAHCGSTDKLQGHHKIPWNENINLRYDENNIVVLCASCHFKVHRDEWVKKGLICAKGKIFSDKHRKNISDSLKGRVPWNKGKSTKISFLGDCNGTF